MSIKKQTAENITAIKEGEEIIGYTFDFSFKEHTVSVTAMIAEHAGETKEETVANVKAYVQEKLQETIVMINQKDAEMAKIEEVSNEEIPVDVFEKEFGIKFVDVDETKEV